MGCRNSKKINKYKLNKPLKDEVLKILLSFGETGLYKSQSISDIEDFEKFKKFCCALKNRLIDSPRNVILKKLTNKANLLYDLNDEVKELYKIIGLNEKVNFIIVINYMDELQEGKLYSRWNVFEAKSKFFPMTEKEEKEAVNNKIQKMLFREEDITKFDEITFLKNIEDIKKRRCQKSKKSAVETKKLLDTNKEYQNYLRAHYLWKKYGFDKLKYQFIQIDSGIGYDRRIRGAVFEEAKGEISFRYIRDYLLKKNNKWSIDNIKPYFNCYWKDENNVKVGEIDILLTYNDLPIAIGELKSNCFDIVAGYNQHKSKIDAHHTIVLKSGKRLEVTKKIPMELFLITLIPENTHLIGTESKLVKMIGDSISSLGNYGKNKSYQDFTLQDFIEFRNSVREKLTFDVSPDQFIRDNWDNIIIFDKR